MAPTVRLKKSLNEGRTFGKRKNSKSESSGDGRDKFRSSPRRNVEGEGRVDDRPRFRSNSRGNGGGEGRGDDRPRFRSNSRGYGEGEGRGDDRPRFRSNLRSYGKGEERGYLSTEKKFVRRGGDSGSKGFGRRPRYGERRDFGGGDDFGGTRELRGERTGGRKGRVQILQRSELIDELRSRGRKLGWKRRVERMNAGETMSPKPREMRGDRRLNRVEDGEDDSGGTRVMRGSHERGGRQGEVNDEVRPRGRKLGRGRNDENGEDMDGGVDSVEASSDRHRLKWKKMDKNVKNRDESDFVEDLTGHRGGKDGNYRDKGKKMNKGDFVEELLDYNVKGDNESDQVAEKKPVRRPTRVLDKTGKKIRVVLKRSDDSSKETHIPAKKKKRVIKLDPYDTSNKRLDDDTAPSSEKSDENDTEISKNAQFRAIQPSPSILSFVEDNLLGRRRLNELKNAGYNIKLSAPLDNVPFSTSLERERIEENAFRNKLEFFAAAKISSSFPPPTLPEIAFAGRSNVGKSSLLNALTRQWGVVRVSDKPGLTQTINFFNLASKLCLVDLPGYGFAYAKDEAKDAWEELVKEYVSTRVGLERVCVLVDTKWGMKARDHELIDLMEKSTTPYQIVLTKTDLVFPIDVARRAMQIQENLKRNKSIINPVMMVSSKSGAGIRNLRTVLSKITRFVKP